MEAWSTRPERVRMLVRPFVGMAMRSLLSVVLGGVPAVDSPGFERGAADFDYGFVDLMRHQRLPVPRDFGRLGGENVAADPLKYRIVQPRMCLPVDQDFGDDDGGANRRPVIVDADAAQLADDVHDDLGVLAVDTRFGHRDLDLRLAVEVAQVEGDQPVHQSVLGLVNPGILLRVGGEDGSGRREGLPGYS